MGSIVVSPNSTRAGGVEAFRRASTVGLLHKIGRRVRRLAAPELKAVGYGFVIIPACLPPVTGWMRFSHFQLDQPPSTGKNQLNEPASAADP